MSEATDRAISAGRSLEPLLCTVDEAAELLCIGRTKTYRLITDGELRTVQIGRRRLVPRTEVEAFVAGLLEAS